jgi:peptidyl-tRNA hydrolase, PTH1 family
MRLFVGLGNPGAKYAGNRHNIGFMAVDRIAADHGFSAWRRAFKGLVAEGRLGSVRVILLKPETFMNLSGESVRAAADFYKLGPEAVTVFHDELDLAPGKCRVKQGGGHAGHNGLRSIHAHLGMEYGRVRLGIGHPGHKDAVAGYVLHDFAKADADWLDDLMRGISDGAEALAEGMRRGSRTRWPCGWPHRAMAALRLRRRWCLRPGLRPGLRLRRSPARWTRGRRWRGWRTGSAAEAGVRGAAPLPGVPPGIHPGVLGSR